MEVPPDGPLPVAPHVSAKPAAGVVVTVKTLACSATGQTASPISATNVPELGILNFEKLMKNPF
jgi:hypothetical protein